MKRVKMVSDLGIVLSPDLPGEALYSWDGGGIREAVLMEENGWHYLSYDAAMPGARPVSYWNGCLARSKDFLHWEKLGPKLMTKALEYPDALPEDYKDLRSASSPWTFYDGKKWHIFYLGADHCSPQGVPAFAYSTMYAWADHLEGEWHQRSSLEGMGDQLVLALGKPGEWDDVTASPGEVMENPLYNPLLDSSETEDLDSDNETDSEVIAAQQRLSDPAIQNKNANLSDKSMMYSQYRYVMFYSGSCSGITRRSIGLAFTNQLDSTGKSGDPNGAFWVKAPEPIITPYDDIENSSIYYDPETRLYYLFTNHIYNNEYTDSIWVYWTKDILHWSEDQKAIVMDASMNNWAKGAIGMPAVKKMDDGHLIMLFDAVKGDGTGHLQRHIGAATIGLPIQVE